MALYGAPIWVDALSPHNRTLLRRPQRVMATRAVRGYCTISAEAACVLAATPPWELDAQMLADTYKRSAEAKSRGQPLIPEETRRLREISRQHLLEAWSRQLEEPRYGQRTVAAFRPILHDWVERRQGVLSFHMTQVLSGHGCFGSYLFRVGRERSRECHQCGCADDTAQHALEDCPDGAVERAELVSAIGADLSLPAVAEAMVSGERSFAAVSAFCGAVMTRREEAERQRPLSLSPLPANEAQKGGPKTARLRPPTAIDWERLDDGVGENPLSKCPQDAADIPSVHGMSATTG